MTSDMTKGNPLKIFIYFTIPLLIGNIFQQLYSMVDTIIVGRFVGVNALAALGACNSLFFLVNGLVLGLTSGFAVLVAQKFGAKDEKGVKKAVASNITLTIVLTVIITIVALLAVKPLLNMMNTPENIYEDARVYITLIYAGIITQTGYNMAAGILRALGDSKTPLYFLIVASILNVILDLIFIINFNMGVAGAAYATNIAQGVSAVLCFIYSYKKFKILRLKKEDFKVEKEYYTTHLKIAIPMSMQFSVTAVGIIIIQSAINTFGSVVIASYTAASKVLQLVMQPSTSFGVTVATYAGQNLGAGKIERIFKGIKESMLLVIGYGIVACIFMIFFGKYLSLLFVAGNETSVINDAQQFLICNSIFYFVLGILFVSRNTIQGLGKSALTMLAGGAELVARAFVAFALVGKFGYNAICFANPIAWFAAIIILIPTLVILMNKLKKEHN